jgi:BirA family biotin operon repressor/biotin-[acetyl-CoA-carboxylase] ligase
MAESGAPHGSVVVAESQSAGRGRNGRVWHSPRGGAWLSILIRPQNFPELLSSLPLVGALGIAESLVQSFGVDARVRWPNDVVVGWRKIAGVLVESKSKGNELLYAVLGLGINANFDTNKIESINRTSTSLLALLGIEVDRELLISTILSETERLYECLYASREDLVVLLRELECSRGRHVKIVTATREVVGIVDDYESLNRVRIATPIGLELIENDALVSVDYQSD